MRSKEYPAIGEFVCREQMENGLTIYVDRKMGYNKSTAFFATRYGGADRRFRLGGKWVDTPAGVAHFLEHKMFDMPEGDALTALSVAGASANAFTSSFITAYYFECTGRFEENLRTLLRFVSTPYFMQASVDKEQGIIGQEIRMTEDDPDYALYYGLLQSLYRENPVRDSVAGTVESIAEITPQTLYDCHKVFYNPSNMVLCVAGDQDIRRITDVAREILPVEGGECPVRDYGKDDGPAPVRKVNRREMEVSQPLFMAGAKADASLTGAAAQRLQLTADLALKALMGPSTALYARLYRDGLINQTFLTEFESNSGASFALFGGESRDPDAVVQEVTAQAAAVERAGLDTELFERLKKATIGEQLRGLDSFNDVCYTMAQGYFRGYDPFEACRIIESIGPDEAAAFLREHLAADRLALSVVSGAR